VEFEKILFELNSAREIIRVLQENGNYGGQAECENTSRPQEQEEGKGRMNDENMDGWTRVTKGYGKCAQKPVAKQAQIIPTCVNRFVVPSNLKGSAEHLKEQERINIRLMEIVMQEVVQQS
jgi:hypothetical protein